MYPFIPTRVVPEENQQFVVFLQPNLLPYMNGVVVPTRRDDSTESPAEAPTEPSSSGVVKAVFASLMMLILGIFSLFGRLRRQPETQTERLVS